MQPAVGSLVLMEHPHLYDEYVIAKLVAQTSKTFQVIYWIRSCNEWNDKIRRRKITAVKRVLHSNVDELSIAQLSKLGAQLTSMTAERDQRIKNAKAAFTSNILHQLGVK